MLQHLFILSFLSVLCMSFHAKLSARAYHSIGLCVGIDPDMDKLPHHLPHSIESLQTFCEAIIQATHQYATAFKLNTAFFEQYGAEGWFAMESVVRSIPKECIVIMDAKRGDIGNTSHAYARAFFERMNADALTVAPYMGRDSVEPFLQYDDRFVFVLGLTSNSGARDFQYMQSKEHNEPLYLRVMESTLLWTEKNNCGFVVGATKPEELAFLRTRFPHSCFLIPGVGTQGGDMATTIRANGIAPALINVSRAILYASSDADYTEQAHTVAQRYLRELHISVDAIVP